VTIQLDPAQEAAQRLFEELALTLKKQRRFFQKSIQGIYLWGHVGRGKTMLMDRFFEALPFPEKKRLHFHLFMHWLHDSLKACEGIADPLGHVIKEFGKKTRVLCFDEFFVNNIADAMLFSGILKAFSRYRVVLVITSNVPPEELYRSGLQRTRFLPAIEWLQQHTQVIHLGDGIDYRLRVLERQPMIWYPWGAAADQGLWSIFSALVHKNIQGGTIQINHRQIPVLHQAEGVIWFEFSVLCESYRNAQDYLEIASIYQTLFLSHIPVLINDESSKRFIDLIDVLYDAHTTLIMSAMTDIDELYQGERWAFEFTRTRSRLWEMQSTAYLSNENSSRLS
jgi:cell division protein ZapE